MSELGRYFVVIHGPNRPRVMVDDDDGNMALWPTPEAARESVKRHRDVRAFGAEIFELCTAQEEV